MSSTTPKHPALGTTYVLHGTMVSGGTQTEDAVVAVMDGLIAYAGPLAGFDRTTFPAAETLELTPGSLILPGLIDLHSHGAAGGGFPDSDEAACRQAVEFLHRSGTTTLLASMVTASERDLTRGIGVLNGLWSEGLIAGTHLEGPFLSHARCGAQNPDWLREPDPELARRLITAAGGSLKTMTYAPELAGAGELVRILVEGGVTPSLGHTDADSRTTAASLREAAELLITSTAQGHHPEHARPTITHLFNGMPPLHHRSPGPVAACLRLAAAGEIVVELIGDGIHLGPETVRMVFELVGADNIALVTDSMAATGLPDGDYVLGPSAVVVRDGVARLHSNNALAGGTSTLLEAVRRTVAAGVSPADAVKAATLVPARVLGMEEQVGSLRPGTRADIVVTDPEFGLRAVFRAGRNLLPE